MNLDYDVVIIGTGAGGGTVADRLAPLARSGAKIVLLEAGANYSHEYFTQREIEMMGLFWYGGAWPIADGSITVAAGKAVGGSTVMYTGVTFRIPDDVVEEWSVPGLDADDLRPRFEALEKEVNAIEPGEDMINDNNRLFKEGCDKLGWPIEKIMLNLRNCEQMGFCNLGCSSGGKQGTMEVQIPRALEAGVELIPNCEVEKVAAGKVYAEVKPPPPGTKPGPWKEGRVEINAKRVVVAGGSPGSPALLMRSGFNDRFTNLGRYFTLHPALTVYGIYPERIKNYRGFPKTYYTPMFSRSHDHYIETAFYYPFISTKHLGLWGADLKRVMKKYNQFMTMIILNHDKALPENRVTIGKNGEIKMMYKISRESVKSLCHAQAQATRIFFAAGCDEVVMPCSDRMIIKAGEVPDDKLEDFISPRNFIPNKMPLSSAHPQGGCMMGKGPEDSVCDCWGQVHGEPWLYVADASLFPKSSHVNPYLTIMALADRVAQRLKETRSEWN